MIWHRAPQAGLIQQALVPLAIGTAIVAVVTSVLVYQRASGNQREEILRDILDATRIRLGQEQGLLDRHAQQLGWCRSSLLLRQRVASGPEIPVPGSDGCRRLVAPGNDTGLSVFVTPAVNAAQLAEARLAAQVVQELGHASGPSASGVMIIAPGRWMAGWGSQPAMLAADMLPEDPLLLPVERDLLEGHGEVRWTHAFLEPATDRWLVAAGATADLPEVGTVVVLQVIPAEDILARLTMVPDSAPNLTVVFDRRQHILTSSLDHQHDPVRRGEMTLTTSGNQRLEQLSRYVVAQGDPVEVIADPDGSGWYAVGRLTGPGWAMVTFHETAEVAADARSLVVDTLLLCLLLFISQGIVVMAVLRWRVQRPLAQLTSAVTSLEAGTQHLTLDLRREDEVGHLAKAFSRMAQAVAQREAELITARQAAEKSDQAKTEFLGMMSHELRTPMTGILGMTEILLETPLDGEQKDMASTTLTCAQSLLGIIDDILDYTRLDADRMELEQVAFNLHALVHDVADVLSLKATGQGVLLLVDWTEELPANAVGDPNRLRQILVNLIGNAVKFTHRGHILVRVRRNGHLTSIAVQDTGIGIASTRLMDIFHPFVQADATMSRRYGGSGLGLTITGRLARLMGGSVQVESREGEGSTFTVELPLVIPEGQQVTAGSTGVGQRIMILDRDPASGRILAGLVHLLGGTSRVCLTLEDVQEALASVELGEPTYDALIVDHSLAPVWPHSATTELPPLISLGARGTLAAGILLGKTTRGHLARPVRLADLERVLIEVKQARQDTTKESSRVDPSWRLHGHVLVVEDSPVYQQLAQRFLEHLGITCDLASGGDEALNQVRQRRYDAILMDCIMPVMDGFTTTAVIRKIGHHGAVPIIAITTSRESLERTRCQEAGMDDILPKPFSAEQLALTLRRWLSPSPSTLAQSPP